MQKRVRWLLAALALTALLAAHYLGQNSLDQVRQCVFGRQTAVSEVFCPADGRSQEVFGYENAGN